MATPGQLVGTMASVLGIPKPTVVQYDRHLAEAGLRQIRGRGRSASRVSAEDAANLLMAILGSPIVGTSIRSAGDTSKRFGSLVVSGFRDTSRFTEFGLTRLSRVPEEHSFKDALVALIEGVSRGETLAIPDWYESYDVNQAFTITATPPFSEAEITINDDSERPPRLVYIPQYISKPEKQTDLYQPKIISFHTIRAIGNLISNEGD
jgi:hypothetical protein